LEDAEALQERAEYLYHEMICVTDRAIEERCLSEFDFTFDEVRAISRSWEVSDYIPTLFTRFDYRIDGDKQPIFVGMASGLSALLLETAVAQWDWLVESCPWSTQFNTISERLTEAWREYRFTGRVVHFAYDPCDPRDGHVAEYLSESALLSGVHALAVPVSALSVTHGRDGIVDGDGQPVDVLVTACGYSRVAGGSLWEAADKHDVCLVEPHWKRLWQHPRWLTYCYESLPLLRGCGPLKPKRGNASGEVICSVWVVAGKVSGLGFSRPLAGTACDGREFLPHLLMS
jgi:glutathionylspermidine synthase